ncbi:3-hydroxyacyl-CoA dehydrogenase family protein [Ulvibacterium sp.]|uniref:3-hydroxyacyl-CoA dehydrogenase family protein n=1 Tax=Ulvibacterium sp. TaxID=2665914 RepID=UPI002630EC31|nr:3-hydroxyacyl-CoA dehydrogenase family protein [Ulvibacterium sp.]
MELNGNAKVGIVGLGLMGTSIATALLINGQEVMAVSPVLSETDQTAPDRIRHALEECYAEGLSTARADDLFQNITFTSKYTDLKSCWLVMECVLEDLKVKQDVYRKIESSVPDEVIIATNTSAIPISMLQNYLNVPERFFGIHWAEPAYTSKFLEIICGEKSLLEIGEQLYAITKKWGKEPTLVRKDIRGFITNRIMYAMYREAFYLVENGYATIEDVDRACKNDGGHWMTFCGLFRYMDLTGLQAYHSVMKDLFPELSNQTTVPKLIDDIAKEGGNGIFNGKGFYEYSSEEAKVWESTFEKFKFDINRLSSTYTDKTKDISSLKTKK